MTNEERDLITRFIQRVGGPPAGGGFAGSVPSTSALPPIDREADALLADLFQRFPEARYRVTQYAFVQEHALAEAQTTIQQLQAQLAQAQAAQAQAAQAQASSPWGAAAQRGSPPPSYAPPPQAAPSGAPGMFQQQGTGFFGSALRTAAGVAGGIFAADALMGLFGGRGGGFGGGGFGGGNTTIIENNYGNAGNDPWGAGGTQADQGGADLGGWTDNSSADPDADMDNDPGGFDNDPNSI